MSVSKNFIKKFKEKSDTIEVALKDLVMIQMTGDLDKFISLLTNKGDINSYIEEVKKSATTLKLFKGIIDKTTEAQFGNRYTFFRELAQNSLDSYDSDIPANDRKVLIKVEEKEDYLIVNVRDYGSGMAFDSLLKDLLIPYNSSKEMDPTKIGEHGIGWFSIVDISDLVGVVTHKPRQKNGSVAFIYKDDNNDWKASVSSNSPNGFSDHSVTHGTEIIAHILKNRINKKEVLPNLYKYIGTVPQIKGDIRYEKNRRINNIENDYTIRISESISVKKESGISIGIISLYISKEFITEHRKGQFLTERNAYRYKNLKNLLVTQRGLYITELKNPFHEKSAHYLLFGNLTAFGIHLWVDIPDCIMLTKGRNNIVAEHVPAIEEALYICFENLYLDRILTDTSLLDHISGSIMEGIANLFHFNFGTDIEAYERKRYSLKRRFLCGLTKTLTFIASIAQGFSGKIIDSFQTMKNKLKEAIKIIPLIKKLPDKILMSSTLALIVVIVLIVSALFWLIPLEKIKLFLGLSAKVLTVGFTSGLMLFAIIKISKPIAAFIVALPEIFIISINKILSIRLIIPTPTGFKISFTGLREAFSSFAVFMLKPRHFPKIKLPPSITKRFFEGLGFFQNMDKRKEMKRQKIRKKISKKYMSGIYKNSFMRKVMNKRIIPAIEFREIVIEDSPREKKKLGFFEEIFNDILTTVGFDGKNNLLYTEKIRVRLSRSEIRLSVDEYIDALLKNKVRAKHTLHTDNPAPGIYVDRNNPLVRAVDQRMEQIRSRVQSSYDVKLFEDYLDSFSGAFKKIISITVSTITLLSWLIFPIMTLSIFIQYHYAKYPYQIYYIEPKPFKLGPVFIISYLTFGIIFFLYMRLLLSSKEDKEKNQSFNIGRKVFLFIIKTLKKSYIKIVRKRLINIATLLLQGLIKAPVALTLFIGYGSLLLYKGIKKSLRIAIMLFPDLISWIKDDLKNPPKVAQKPQLPPQLKDHKERKKWVNNFLQGLIDIIVNTWIGSLFFIRDMNKSFSNVGVSDLSHIPKILGGAGQSYIDELKCLEALNSIVSMYIKEIEKTISPDTAKKLLSANNVKFKYDEDVSRYEEYKPRKKTYFLPDGGISDLWLSPPQSGIRHWDMNQEKGRLQYGLYVISFLFYIRGLRHQDFVKIMISFLRYAEEKDINLEKIVKDNVTTGIERAFYGLKNYNIKTLYKMSHKKLRALRRNLMKDINPKPLWEKEIDRLIKIWGSADKAEEILRKNNSSGLYNIFPRYKIEYLAEKKRLYVIAASERRRDSIESSPLRYNNYNYYNHYMDSLGI